MNVIIKKCEKCGDIARYTPDYKIHETNNCNGILSEVDITDNDFCLLCDISSDNSFLEAMINLKQKDIIEYNLKMSQFKSQVAQEQTAKMQASNKPKCPTCNSTNLKRVSTTSKVASVAMWGLLSQKAKKTWHCNSCGYEW